MGRMKKDKQVERPATINNKLTLDDFQKKDSVYVKSMQSQILSLQNLVQKKQVKKEEPVEDNVMLNPSQTPIIVKEESFHVFPQSESRKEDESLQKKRQSTRNKRNEKSVDNKNIIDVVVKAEYEEEGDAKVKKVLIEEASNQNMECILEANEHPSDIFSFYQEYYRPVFDNKIIKTEKREEEEESQNMAVLFGNEIYYSLYSDMHTISNDEESPYPSNPRPYPFESFLVCKSLIDLHGYPYRDGRESEKEKKTILEEDLRLEEGCHLRVQDSRGRVKLENDSKSKENANKRRSSGNGGKKVEDPEVCCTLNALVRTILSQNTTDKLSKQCFENLKIKFPTWKSVLKASNASVEASIKMGGLSQIKVARIKSILEKILEEHPDDCVNGEPSLKWLNNLSTEEIKTELGRFKGVGPKTISCVLLFNLKRAEFPVDTHVWFIAKRLGWVPSSCSREDCYAHLNARIPDFIKFDLHVLLVEHGKKCQACSKGKGTVLPCDFEGPCPLTGLLKEMGPVTMICKKMHNTLMQFDQKQQENGVAVSLPTTTSSAKRMMKTVISKNNEKKSNEVRNEHINGKKEKRGRIKQDSEEIGTKRRRLTRVSRKEQNKPN